MSYSRSFAALIFVVFASSVAAADEAVEIPLSKIWANDSKVWANDLVKTRDIRELGVSASKAQEQLTAPWQPQGGIAISGEGREALDNFYKLRSENLERNKLSAAKPVSLAFFSGPTSFYVHLRRVERKGNRFTLEYSFEPHQTRDMTSYLALIPIGELPFGNYSVKIVQLPLDEDFKKYEKAVASQRDRVCHSFEFAVAKRESKP